MIGQILNIATWVEVQETMLRATQDWATKDELIKAWIDCEHYFQTVSDPATRKVVAAVAKSLWISLQSIL